MLALALLISAATPANAPSALARLEALNAQEQALTARIGANREAQARLLSALQNASRDPPPALLVSPRSAKDAVRAAVLMRALQPELRRRAEALARQAQALARLRREAAEASAGLFSAQSAAAEGGGSRPPPGFAAAAGPRIEPSPSPLAPLTVPVDGELVRRFGEPWPGRGRSEGLSWRTAADAQVRSPSDGRIDYVGPLKNWGLVVIVLRPDGWRTVVAGMQNADLAPGAQVRAGAPLGRMSPRAKPTPELYLELRRGSNPVDPNPYLLRPRLDPG